jgi:hypothetical protein
LFVPMFDRLHLVAKDMRFRPINRQAKAYRTQKRWTRYTRSTVSKVDPVKAYSAGAV